MFSLQETTQTDWVQTVLENFDPFLIDHAACERKASSVGLSFVLRYPDRPKIWDPMIAFAREELEHFHQVIRLIQKRGLQLEEDTKDEYVNALMKEVRFGREERFLDRLIVSAVIEARGTERLQKLSDALPEGELKAFYDRLTRAENRHKDFFLEMASLYFSYPEIKTRLSHFLELEASIIRRLPLRPAVH